MYTDNHPHIRVLGTLARLALERAGLTELARCDEPADSLANSLHWPVHQPVARRLGVGPSPYFRRSLHDGHPEAARDLRLEEFISGCYATYAQAGDFAPHVRITRAQAALTSLLG